MTDDIVTRLRKYECRCELCEDGQVCESCEAAEEIERLRQRNVELEQQLRYWEALSAGS